MFYVKLIFLKSSAKTFVNKSTNEWNLIGKLYTQFALEARNEVKHDTTWKKKKILAL